MVNVFVVNTSKVDLHSPMHHDVWGLSVFMRRFLVLAIVLISSANAMVAGGIKSRAFVYSPSSADAKPKLILITGSPGTGKSTFGMSLALDQGILKCISTDTIRAVMRSYVPEDICPALHRSSYEPPDDSDGEDNPVKSWKETCKVLESSVEGLVEDSINRGVSLVLEGVSLKPSNKWIKMWEEAGGVACGVLLTVTKEEIHKSLLLKRGLITGNSGAEQKKINSFDRVRHIQDEMIRLARESDWVLIEQKVDPDPLDVVAEKLTEGEECFNPFNIVNNGETKASNESIQPKVEKHDYMASIGGRGQHEKIIP